MSHDFVQTMLQAMSFAVLVHILLELRKGDGSDRTGEADRTIRYPLK